MQRVKEVKVEIETMSQIPNNFTDAQWQVLKHNTGNLLVSASAGSGKTRVLIEKINRLILNGGVKLKRLLVVTFTNSASLEIKQRLATSLAESNDDKLLQELDDLSTSDILTFDAFCIKVVKEFGYSIGLKNDFAVADEALAGFLKNQALDNIIAKHNKNIDARFTNFVSNFFDNRNEKTLRTSIARLHNFLSSKDDSSYYYKKLDELYTFDNNNPAVVFINEYLKNLRDTTLSAIQSLKLNSEMLGEVKLTEMLEIAKSKIGILSGNILNDFDALKFGLQLPTIKKDNKKDSFEVLEIKSKYSTIKKEFVESVKDVLPDSAEKFTVKDMQNDLFKTKQSLLYVFDIVNEFECEYSALKNAYSVLDFNDIEKLANKILSNEKIADEIKNKYDWIFIDEYQDTSKLQESIVEKITTGENLFMVGDLKQSIYRFRQAEPKIFINKYNQYKDMKSSSSVIELATNFRSENCILQFNNFIFDKIYKQNLDDFDYRNNADLEFGGLVKKSGDVPQVKVMIIDEDTSENEQNENESNENQLVLTDEQNSTDEFEVYSVKNSGLSFGNDKDIKKQALLLASEIKDMLGKPYFDVKTGQTRPIDYCDIAVLSRGKVGVISEIKKVLKEVDIPVIAEYSENLFESYDMQILLGILKAIDNSKDDVPLLTALVNIGGVTFEELAKIRKLNRSEKFFYDVLQQYLSNYDDELSCKIKNCFSKLEFYRNNTAHLDIRELVNLIISNEKLDMYFLANDFGVEFENHLQMFFDSIKTIKNYSLSEFLNYLDSFGGQIMQAITEKDGENAVTLTTIHKSKGLEYPVVFLVAAEKKFSFKNQTEKILMDNDWGISMSSFDVNTHVSYENIIKKIFKLKIQLEDKKEEKRLLYVALTRPKNYLTIIGSKKLEKIKPFESDLDISASNCYLDWIMGCFSENIYTQLSLKNVAMQNIGTDEVAAIEVVKNNEFDFENTFKDKTLPEKLKIDSNAFSDILSHNFRHSQLAKKNTVTQIMQETDHYNISDFSYKKTDNFDDEDFLEIGTAYHKFMELINFSNDKTELEQQILELKDMGKVAEKELSLVNQNQIIDAVMQISLLIAKQDLVLKEQQFLVYMPASELVNTAERSKILVQGVADIIIIKENEIYLIDYKTSRITSEEKFKQRYKTQLDIYAKAIESFYQKPVNKKMIYSFYLNKLITI